MLHKIKQTREYKNEFLPTADDLLLALTLTCALFGITRGIQFVAKHVKANETKPRAAQIVLPDSTIQSTQQNTRN